MITQEKMIENRDRIINILRTNLGNSSKLKVSVDDLIVYLDTSDFFYAPASTKYHNSVDGGLCDHVLNVYDNLVKLVTMFNESYSLETITIVALFHDISKINFYEKSKRNKKELNPTTGRDEWVQYEVYAIRSEDTKFVGGTHGANSLLQAEKFFDLTDEEKIAILNHHAGMDVMGDLVLRDLDAILNRYPLTTLLHTADTLAAYINERK